MRKKTIKLLFSSQKIWLHSSRRRLDGTVFTKTKTKTKAKTNTKTKDKRQKKTKPKRQRQRQKTIKLLFSSQKIWLHSSRRRLGATVFTKTKTKKETNTKDKRQKTKDKRQRQMTIKLVFSSKKSGSTAGAGWVGQSSQELFSIISIPRQQEASKFGRTAQYCNPKLRQSIIFAKINRNLV